MWKMRSNWMFKGIKKMNRERTKVDNIRISRDTKKPEICVDVCYHANGWVESEWEDYEEHILHTRVGISPESHQLHLLQYFVDVLNASTKRKEVEKKRDALEEKIETLFDEFNKRIAFAITETEVEAQKMVMREQYTNIELTESNIIKCAYVMEIAR